jgi:hypothetical protein
MQISGSEYAFWITGTALRVLLCTLLLRHRSYRQIPIFSTFIFLGTLQSLLLWWIYHDPRMEAEFVFNTYWGTQLFLVTARGLAAAEICWWVLRGHRGVWALAWRLLMGVGTCLVAFAVLAALHERNWVFAIVSRAERGLELTVIGILVTLFSVCRYYSVQIDPAIKYLAIGLGMHASVQAINNTIAYAWLENFEAWWRAIRGLTFDVTLVLWCWGLRKPMPVPESPRELEPAVYEELAPQVSYRLRQLNERLLEMLK